VDAGLDHPCGMEPEGTRRPRPGARPASRCGALPSRSTSCTVVRTGEAAEAVTTPHVLDVLREVRLPPELPVTRSSACVMPVRAGPP
jgi:hypothetical protein